MPGLRNILVSPKAEVRWVRRGSTGPTAEVRVAGLMCDSLCVRRVRGALEALPGVNDVRFVAEDDTFVVSGASDLPGENEMKAAVAGQVVLPRMRRWLGWVGKSSRLAK